jgi:hypothetical protein
VFDLDVNNQSGLRLTNVKVKDSYASNSVEEVFDFIDFTDFETEFTDGTTKAFDASHFLSQSSGLAIGENGTRTWVVPNDTLFQRGVNLSSSFNLLHDEGGRCDAQISLSVVFRGANNDFDPGGIPTAMDLWPQIEFVWYSDKATKKVKRFRGSVRFQLRNVMRPMGAVPAGTENVPGFYTDSNESFKDGRSGHGLIGRAFIGAKLGNPFGWSMVFDYLTANFRREKEIVGVYGPNDGYKYKKDPGAQDPGFQGDMKRRRIHYKYPRHTVLKIILDKRNRQGDFDNTHTHAKMANLDRCSNVQIHAPFCGHSCIHLHWRWSALAVTGASGGRGWQFKGWSGSIRSTRRHTAVVTPRAYTSNGAPLIPPNQRLSFAICAPNQTRHSHDHIVDPNSPGLLDARTKLNWYCVDVINPLPKQRQVIFEQGMGWAYRYANHAEAPILADLDDAFNDDLPWFDTPSIAEMNKFMEQVYEEFRYIDGMGILCGDQAPSGQYTDADHSTLMEEL